MSFLFDRIAKVILGVQGDEGLLFDEKFRISFDVQKNRTDQPNFATITIYNLSEDDRNKIEKIPNENLHRPKNLAPLIVALYAGYREGDGYQLLYTGNIVMVENNYTAPNFTTVITCADGYQPTRDALVNLSFAAGVNSNNMIQQVAKTMEMDINSASDYLNRNFSRANGQSFTGKAKDALNKITQDAGLQWHIEKGQIVITNKNQPTKDTVVLLTKTSGLIGVPQKTGNQQGDAVDVEGYNGWKAVSLLQPILNPARRVRIETSVVADNLLVDSVNHKGDTRGAEWTSTLETRAYAL